MRRVKKEKSMKKPKLLFFGLILIFCSLTLAACGAPALSRPVNLKIDEDTLALTWRKVTDARYYEVSINGTEYESRENSYPLENLVAGEYNIRVRACSNNEDFSRSKWSDTIKFTRESESGLGFTLVNNKSEYHVTSIGSLSGDIVIPDTFRGKPVTAIGDRAFVNSTKLTGITMPDTIKSIGSRAFFGCTYLKSVVFSENLETVGDFAFRGCRGLTGEITLPESVTEIQANAFASCANVTSFKLGGNLKTIGNSAFMDCDNVGKIVIPDSVETIGEYAFSGSVNATELTFGAKLKTIGRYAFFKLTKLENVVIGSGVEEIGNFAFAACEKLKKVVISDSVKAIGESAFAACTALDDVTMGKNVENILPNAFTNTKLWNDVPETEPLVYVGNWLVSNKNRTQSGTYAVRQGTVGICARAFRDCNEIVAIILPDSVKYINEQAFYSCDKLQTATIGKSVISIGANAFNSCPRLQSVFLGSTLEDENGNFSLGDSSLTTIGSYAFRSCPLLNSIEIPETVTTIGTDAFKDTGMWSKPSGGVVYADNWAVGFNGIAANITLREDTVGIANYAFFQNDNLMTLNAAKVKLIGRSAFYECKNLWDVTLPDTLERLEDYTFYKCESLSIRTLPGALTYIGRSAFYNCKYLGTGRIPTNEWTGNGTNEYTFEIPNGVKTIGDYAFYGCGDSQFNMITGQTNISGMTNLNFGSSVESVGNYAFMNCFALKNVIMSNSIKTIGDRSFYRCENLETVRFSRNLERISERAFYGCVKLRRVALPASVSEIGNYAFYRCSGLTTLEFNSDEEGNSVRKIGDYAFYGCENLTDVDFPISLEIIGKQAFRNCKALTGLTLRATVTEVGAHAFYGCSGLTVYTELSTLPENWHERWNSSFRPAVWGTTMSADKSYIVSFTKTQAVITNSNIKTSITAPTREGYAFVGWSVNPNGATIDYNADGIVNAPDGTVLYAIWSSKN